MLVLTNEERASLVALLQEEKRGYAETLIEKHERCRPNDDTRLLTDLMIVLKRDCEDPDAAAEYLTRYASAPDADVRRGVAHALADRSRPVGLGVLISLLGDDDEATRRWAATGVARLAEFTSSPEILEASVSTDWYVRRELVSVIDPDDADGSRRLQEMAASDPSWRVRRKARRVLARTPLGA